MQANYGFKDGSGDWFLAIDTDKCDGCGKCVEACPANVLEVGEDEFDPFRDEPVAKVRQEERKKIRYSCAPCHPGSSGKTTPCSGACPSGSISHSDGWAKMSGN